MSVGAPGVGIDVGGTSTRVVVFDGAGNPGHTATSVTPQGLVALVDHHCREFAEAAAASARTVGVPGGVRDGTVTMAIDIGVGVSLGDRLVDRVRARLRRAEHASPFLRSIQLGDRVVPAPHDVELGALGADRAARLASPPVVEPAP